MRKYIMGKSYKTIEKMLFDISVGKTLWDKMTNKPINSAFLMNWQYRCLVNAYKRERFCMAKLNPEYLNFLKIVEYNII